MGCPTDEELAALVAGSLAPGDLARVASHLSGCESCAAKVTSQVKRSSQVGPELATVDLPPGAPRAELSGPRVEAPPSLAPGAQVGRYLVEGEVGEGGMGKVYAALDPELDRKVALKLLNLGAVSRRSAPELRTRMLREAQAMARLSHPNVVAIYDVGTFGEQVFLAMELVQGVTLRDWLKQKPRTTAEVLEVFKAAGEGLAAAHQAGLVHRDFKPGNVLIGADQRVRVLDFGLARAATGASEQTPPQLSAQALAEPAAQPHGSLASPLTREGQISGTTGYIAPEVIFSGRTDARSDQFAFCVALYDALYGHKPWPERAMADYVTALKMVPAPPEPKDSDVPAWVTRVVLKGLAHDPAERFGTMRQLLDALGKDPAVARRRAALVALGAAAVLLGGAGLAGFLRGGEAPCGGEARRLQGVWDQAVRASMEQAFLATRRVGAADTFARVARQLDSYATEWVQQANATCREKQATRQEHSQELLLLRMVCLERRRGELTALTELLGRADPEVVDQAVNASRLLLRPERCIDPRVLTGGSAVLTDPVARAKTELLRSRLDVAKALFDSGKFPRAIEAARRIAEDARADQLVAVEAEALNLQGKVQGRAYQLADAVKTLTAALAAAQASQVDIEIFNAAVRLAHVLNLSSRSDEAEQVLKIAEATQKRLGDDELLVADLMESKAGGASRAHRLDEAFALRTRVHELKLKRLGEDHPETVAALINLSKTAGDQGHIEASIGYSQRALDISEKALGTEHPALILIRCNLCFQQATVGRYELAAGHCQRGAALAEKIHGPEAPLLGWCLGNLSYAQSGAGQGEAAVASGTRAVAITARAQGDDNVELAEPLLALGRGKLVLHRYAEARADCERGLTLAERDLNGQDITIGGLLTCVGCAQLGQGQQREAVATLTRALGVRRTDGVPSDRADTSWALAQALWASGQKPQAVQQAAEALKDLEPFEALAPRRAEIQKWLAGKP